MRCADNQRADARPWYRYALSVGLAALLVSSTLACSSPTRPTASVVAAEPQAPALGSQLSYYSQPVTLVLSKSVATSGATASTTVDIATDATFTTVTSVSTTVDTAIGQIRATVDHLQPSTTYYWRAKTVAGETSLTSTVSRFTVGPPVVIQPPQAMGPTGNVESRRPTLVLANAARTGPAGAIRYRFEIATDPGFASIVSVGTVDEGAGETRFTPSGDLEAGRTFYWRAQATDTSTGVTSPVTSTATFRTLFAVVDGPYRLTIVILYRDQSSYSVVVDGTLQTLGARLKFVASRAFATNPLTFDVTRAGEELAGGADGASSVAPQPDSITGSTPETFWVNSQPEEHRVDPARVSGSVNGNSSLSGVVDGYLGRFSPYHDGGWQSGVFQWTLIRQ